MKPANDSRIAGEVRAKVLPISVVVVAKDAERTIEGCLESVRRNSPAEIIIVDGNSTDSTVELAGRYTEKLYSDGGRGLSYARQLGAERAAEDYVAYVDSDIILPDGTLETMLAQLRIGQYAGIQALIKGISRSRYLEWAESRWEELRNRQTGEKEWISTIATIFKREVILKYKFDPSFPHSDDADLSYRLRREGHKLGLSSAVAYHHFSVDLNDFMNRVYRRGMADAEFVWKHKLKMPKISLLPFALAPYGGIFSIRKKEPRLIPYFLLYSVLLIAGFAKRFMDLLLNKVKASKVIKEITYKNR